MLDDFDFTPTCNGALQADLWCSMGCPTWVYFVPNDIIQSSAEGDECGELSLQRQDMTLVSMVNLLEKTIVLGPFIYT